MSIGDLEINHIPRRVWPFIYSILITQPPNHCDCCYILHTWESKSVSKSALLTMYSCAPCFVLNINTQKVSLPFSYVAFMELSTASSVQYPQSNCHSNLNHHFYDISSRHTQSICLLRPQLQPSSLQHTPFNQRRAQHTLPISAVEP